MENIKEIVEEYYASILQQYYGKREAGFRSINAQEKEAIAKDMLMYEKELNRIQPLLKGFTYGKN